jgi:hypothetical protein
MLLDRVSGQVIDAFLDHSRGDLGHLRFRPPARQG